MPLSLLRTQEEAVAFCRKSKLKIGKTKTKTKSHHQSPKALIAAVSGIAKKICKQRKLNINDDPQKRCVWFENELIHTTARNLDGTIEGLLNPTVIWEIKEYWGKTKGGSKMSDAVYECQLVGRELREYEERSKIKHWHCVFLDGKEQWSYRKSDLKRFIDLKNQGLIDRLFIGKQVEDEWELELCAILDT